MIASGIQKAVNYKLGYLISIKIKEECINNYVSNIYLFQ
jgi:hypothetical protein